MVRGQGKDSVSEALSRSLLVKGADLEKYLEPEGGPLTSPNVVKPPPHSQP